MDVNCILMQAQLVGLALGHCPVGRPCQDNQWLAWSIDPVDGSDWYRCSSNYPINHHAAEEVFLGNLEFAIDSVSKT